MLGYLNLLKFFFLYYFVSKENKKKNTTAILTQFLKSSLSIYIVNKQIRNKTMNILNKIVYQTTNSNFYTYTLNKIIKNYKVLRNFVTLSKNLKDEMKSVIFPTPTVAKQIWIGKLSFFSHFKNFNCLLIALRHRKHSIKFFCESNL